MAVASKIGDWAFKAFTAGLGLATVYMTATFSLNIYRGLAWHKEQKVSILLLLVHFRIISGFCLVSEKKPGFIVFIHFCVFLCAIET